MYSGGNRPLFTTVKVNVPRSSYTREWPWQNQTTSLNCVVIQTTLSLVISHTLVTTQATHRHLVSNKNSTIVRVTYAMCKFNSKVDRQYITDTVRKQCDRLYPHYDPKTLDDSAPSYMPVEPSSLRQIFPIKDSPLKTLIYASL